MGCFLACFGGPKDRKRRKAVHRIPPRERVKVPESSRLLQPISPPALPPQRLGVSPLLKAPQLPKLLPAESLVPDSNLQFRSANEGWKSNLKQLPDGKSPSPPVEARRDDGDKSCFSSPKKKVTFDLNVTTYEQIPSAHDGEVDSSVEVRGGGEEEEEEGKNIREDGGLAPPASANHRYQNCLTDDEEDDYDYDDDDDCDDGDEEEEEGDDCDDGENEEGESYDSYFSLQMEKERQQAFNEVSSAAKPIACCSPDRKPTAPVVAAASQAVGRDRSQYVHSVLNPVENLSQWKSVKAKTGSQPLKNPRKENISLESGVELPEFKLQRRNQKISCDSTSPSPISVDASLSNWLPSSGNQENSPCRSNSSVSREERPILGALTAEDLKNSPTSSSSPRKSPIRSPDDMPILGTVGSYWSRTNLERDSGSSQRSPDSSAKGIPNTTSKYREDRRVNWHSTPFEIRLERTLNRGDAEAY